jgi:hypothetical protein
MNNQTISDLRDAMFDTLRQLRDPKSPMDIDRANAIKDVAQVIINSAKVEIDYLRVAGGAGTGFIPQQTADRSIAPPASVTPITKPVPTGADVVSATKHGTKTVSQLPNGATITRHRMS